MQIGGSSPATLSGRGTGIAMGKNRDSRWFSAQLLFLPEILLGIDIRRRGLHTT